ncbi:MAG: D-alanyl-D-alanine carboxypeptidase [Lachnospiraceae bacterium]|nr:D-alanyl-D-alanine carboxypeptidase [Candidatus Hippenecus merdae]
MKKLNKITALALIMSLLFAGAAQADTVVLADRPFGSQVKDAAAIRSAEGAAPGSESTGSAPGQGKLLSDPGAGSAAGGPASAASAKGGVEPETNEIVIDSKIPLPQIVSDTAVLMDAATGQVLFEKEGLKSMYPASTTKLMTALLTAEKFSMTDSIKFSSSATTGLESGAVTAYMTAGETMTVKDALHALLLYSACEVANALGENVAGNEAALLP